MYKNKILCRDDRFYRIYIEYVDEETARHTSFIWSSEMGKMIPYDSYIFNYTKYNNTWNEYVENMLKIRKNWELK